MIKQIMLLSTLLFTISHAVENLNNITEIEGLSSVKFGDDISKYSQKRPTAGKGVYELYGDIKGDYDYLEVSSYANIIFEISAFIRHNSISEAKKEAIEIKKQLEKKYHYKFHESHSNLSAILQSFVTDYSPSRDVEISIMVIDSPTEPVSITLTLENRKMLSKALDTLSEQKNNIKKDRLNNL